MSFRDASSQTERPEDLDEATKTDILESFAMELFLTSVLPRREFRFPLQRSTAWHGALALAMPISRGFVLSEEMLKARHCNCRLEAVLVQNHSFDVWHDDLGSLAEEDVLAASGVSATLSELQSFTDMNYSQGRCVAALQWVPARKVMPAPCFKDGQSFPEHCPREGACVALNHSTCLQAWQATVSENLDGV